MSNNKEISDWAFKNCLGAIDYIDAIADAIRANPALIWNTIPNTPWMTDEQLRDITIDLMDVEIPILSGDAIGYHVRDAAQTIIADLTAKLEAKEREVEAREAKFKSILHKLEKDNAGIQSENATLKAEVERLKIDASNNAYKADRAKAERDRAEAEVERLKGERDTFSVKLIQFTVDSFIRGYFGEKARHVNLSREDAEIYYKEYLKQKG